VESLLGIVFFIVVISGFLAFTGAIKVATTVAQYVFYIGVVVFAGVLIAMAL